MREELSGKGHADEEAMFLVFFGSWPMRAGNGSLETLQVKNVVF